LEGWEGAEGWDPETLLTRYRQRYPEREAELAADLATATAPVRNQAAFLRPSILRRLRGGTSLPPLVASPKPAPKPERVIERENAAASRIVRAPADYVDRSDQLRREKEERDRKAAAEALARSPHAGRAPVGGSPA
jgi:hypothetical protein